jgi:hypothetical protein
MKFLGEAQYLPGIVLANVESSSYFRNQIFIDYKLSDKKAIDI